MKGVVLAGGTGSRLRPITHTGPKQLVPVANKPVIQYGIEDLRDAGITEVAVVVGRNEGAEAIRSFLGDGSALGVEITYVVQGEPLGLAHAVGCTESFVGDDDFVVYLGDNILNSGIDALVDSFTDGDYAAGIALQVVDDPTQYGIAAVDESGAVTRLVEKPDDPPSDRALIGVYVFAPRVFEVIAELEPSWRGELEITDALQTFLDEGEPLDSHTVEGWWKDTGKPEDILSANRLVLGDQPRRLAGTVADDAEVAGRVDLAETATVESGAAVRGPVSIGPGTVIESGTYVGPYTSIGPECTLVNAHVENSVLVGQCRVTTEKRIVDSLVGRHTVVGNADGLLPDGQRLVVGENSHLKL